MEHVTVCQFYLDFNNCSILCAKIYILLCLDHMAYVSVFVL
jgi:hypothetical protein